MLYGISIEEYESMLESQSGLCAICAEPGQKLFVDHNHQTGKVRGLLCPSCNGALGMVREDLAIIDSLKAYVIIHES